MASASGMSAIAITDHDTLAGTLAAREHGIPPSLGFLSGVEISADPPAACPGKGSFHILGYGFDCDDTELNRMLTRLESFRRNRNPSIIRRLNDLGVSISLEEVAAASGPCQLGRPHIARMMVSKGVVASIDEAFDRFLGTGKPAYVEKTRVSCKDAIYRLRAAGGVPVLAHPGLLPLGPGAELEFLVDNLIEMGLEGIEAHYPLHSARLTAYFVELAADRELLVTGGTDFHGAITPEIRMGTGRGDFYVPHALFTRLVERHSNVIERNAPL